MDVTCPKSTDIASDVDSDTEQAEVVIPKRKIPKMETLCFELFSTPLLSSNHSSLSLKYKYNVKI